MKIVEIAPKQDYRLYLRYDDGSEGIVDLSAYAGRGVFSAWLKPGIFEQVQLTANGSPEWPHEIDLCPDALHMQLTGKSSEEIFPSLNRLPTHA